VSVVRLIVATRSSNILISGKIIKEMPGSIAWGTPCINGLCIPDSMCKVNNFFFLLVKMNNLEIE